MLVFVLSQSGETADTLGALREAKRRGYPTLGICNEQMAATRGTGVQQVVGGDRGEPLGGKGSRWWAGGPGWPPGRRRSWPGGGCGLGGLMMSEEGGLEEVEESLRAAASCRCNWATVARRVSNAAREASTSACNRWQLVQGGIVSIVMVAESIRLMRAIQHGERLPRGLGAVTYPGARGRTGVRTRLRP